MIRTAPRMSCLLLLAVILGCGGGTDDPTGPGSSVVATVTVAASSQTLTAIGATTQATATAKNANGETISGQNFSWSTSNGNVATVSSTGLITAVTNGSATITATITGGTIAGSTGVTVLQAVSTLAIAQQNPTVTVGGTLQLTATAQDSRNNAIVTPQLTWSSNSAAATVVSSSGLLTGVADGTAVITVTSGTVSATTNVIVQLPELNLTSNSSLSGTNSYRSITIPAGITVTASGPLMLRSKGLVTIAGTITGECVEMDIRGDTAVVVNGTVNNGCAAGTAAPLRIGATGELTLSGATVRSSGNIHLANHPALLASTSLHGSTLQATHTGSSPGIPFTIVSNTTVQFFGGEAGPTGATNGASGTNGSSGSNGSMVSMVLDGNAIFAGNTLLWGQDAGSGGNGTNTSNANVTALGGNGGSGGLVKIHVAGTLTYNGIGNIVRGGAAGDGGNATATGMSNAFAAKGPNATATAGNGGPPGLVDIVAGGIITIENANSLTLQVGAGGDGGDAVATGANGLNATATTAAQEGGTATASGGHGSETPNARLIATVTGSVPTITGIGGGAVNGGQGGNATGVAGNGGVGSKEHKTGGRGGALTVNGGNGGNASLRNHINAIIGLGGSGGDASFASGNGGAGWNGCITPSEPGGTGGMGSASNGGSGEGGTGVVAGTNGTTFFNNVGNGGNGGNGVPEGSGGAAGTNAVNAAGAQTTIGSKFTAGEAGTDCAPAEVKLQNAPPFPFPLPAGVHTSQLINAANQVIGSVPVSAFGPPESFNRSSGGLLWGEDSRWEVHVAEAIVDGRPYLVTKFAACLPEPQLARIVENTSQRLALQPIRIEQVDAFGSVALSVLLGEYGCREFELLPATRKVRFIGTGELPVAIAENIRLRK